MEKILRFPKTIQVLTMRDNPDSREKITETISATDEMFTRIVKAAYIQTSDGFYVKMDTSILYRIEDPVKLVNMVGAGKLYEDNGILPVAENAIKVRLGTLQPEDFFDAKIRVAKLDEARDLMNEKRLLPEHCFHRALPFHFTRLAVGALVWPDQGSLHSSITISGSTTISDFTELATRLYFCAACSARRVRASITSLARPPPQCGSPAGRAAA